MNDRRFFRGLMFAAPLSLLLWCGIAFAAIHEIPAPERHYVAKEVRHLAHVVRHPLKDVEQLFG
ncbi:MAG: hypothetical protein K2X68_01945 [Novosphingobium sp.]|nr:hypothetical protein [Novosphingobium sp.]